MRVSTARPKGNSNSRCPARASRRCPGTGTRASLAWRRCHLAPWRCASARACGVGPTRHCTATCGQGENANVWRQQRGRAQRVAGWHMPPPSPASVRISGAAAAARARLARPRTETSTSNLHRLAANSQGSHAGVAVVASVRGRRPRPRILFFCAHQGSAHREPHVSDEKIKDTHTASFGAKRRGGCAAPPRRPAHGWDAAGAGAGALPVGAAGAEKMLARAPRGGSREHVGTD